MREIPTKSINLIITSVPYNCNKSYDIYDDNKPFDEYMGLIEKIIKECHRVLKPGGRMCINVLDTPISTDIKKKIQYHVQPSSAYITYYATKSGFMYMNSIKWKKHTDMKGQGGGAILGSYPYPTSVLIKSRSEYILVFKKKGIADKTNKNEKDKLTLDEWKELSDEYWEFNGKHNQRHPASFPIELPYRLILMFSFTGDVVLDPMIGCGTTAIAAKMADRQYVGYDISSAYIKEAENWLLEV